jgi:hypothetical protein
MTSAHPAFTGGVAGTQVQAQAGCAGNVTMVLTIKRVKTDRFIASDCSWRPFGTPKGVISAARFRVGLGSGH